MCNVFITFCSGAAGGNGACRVCRLALWIPCSAQECSPAVGQINSLYTVGKVFTAELLLLPLHSLTSTEDCTQLLPSSVVTEYFQRRNSQEKYPLNTLMALPNLNVKAAISSQRHKCTSTWELFLLFA